VEEKTVYGRRGSRSRWRAVGVSGSTEERVRMERSSIVVVCSGPGGMRRRLWQCPVSVPMSSGEEGWRGGTVVKCPPCAARAFML
jgi:hypothetical protein